MAWLIEHKGKNRSLAEDVNFFYRHKDKIFLMDNHRLALWSWWQTLEPGTYNLFHVDAHYDNCPTALDFVKEFGPKISELNLEDYINLGHPKGFKVFRWDNYFPIFLNDDRFKIDKLFSMDHHIGEKFADKGPHRDFEQVDSPCVFRITEALKESEFPAIVNIDFDYFFTMDEKIQLFSDEYINKLFKEIKGIDRNLAVLTVCLSPECCGGWANAESILAIFSSVFEIDWKYPFS